MQATGAASGKKRGRAVVEDDDEDSKKAADTSAEEEREEAVGAPTDPVAQQRATEAGPAAAEGGKGLPHADGRDSARGGAIPAAVLRALAWHWAALEHGAGAPLDSLPVSYLLPQQKQQSGGVMDTAHWRAPLTVSGPRGSAASGQLLGALAQGLDIRLNTAAAAVQYGKQGVTVTTASGGRADCHCSKLLAREEGGAGRPIREARQTLHTSTEWLSHDCIICFH